MQEGFKFIWLTLCLTWERQRKALRFSELYCAFRNLRTVSFPLLASLFLSINTPWSFHSVPIQCMSTIYNRLSSFVCEIPGAFKQATASFSAHLLLQSSWKDNEFGISRWRIMNIALRREEWRISPLFFCILFLTNSHVFDSDIKCCEWLSMGRECAFYSFPPRHFTPFNPLTTSSYFVTKIIIIHFGFHKDLKMFYFVF